MKFFPASIRKESASLRCANMRLRWKSMPNTVARSFDYLQGLSVIFNRRGIGYFVAEGACAAIRSLRRRVFEEEELPELFRRMDLLGITLDDVRMIYAKRSVK